MRGSAAKSLGKLGARAAVAVPLLKANLKNLYIKNEVQAALLAIEAAADRQPANPKPENPPK